MRIASKMTLLTLTSVLLTVVLLCTYFALELRQALVDGELRHQQSQLALRAQSFHNSLEVLRADAYLLGESPVIKHWFSVQHTQSGEALEYQSLISQSFSLLLSRHPQYFQARILSSSGMELIRMERVGGELIQVEPAQLQDKSARDYFSGARQLKRGQVYLSAINLNEEFGVISQPEIPTIRASTPIFDQSGVMVGVVVINKNIDQIVRDMVSASPIEQVSIVDANGHFISHSNPAFTFAPQRGTQHSLASVWPNIARSLRGVMDGNAQSASIENVIHDNFVVNARKVVYSAGKGDTFITIVQMTPSSYFIQQIARAFKRQLGGVVIVILLCVAAAWLFSRLVAKRILLIRTLSEAVAEGGRELTLPQVKQDEVDDVASAFKLMVDKVSDREQTLRSHSQKIDEIMNTVSNGVITTTVDGYIEEVNLFAARLFGGAREEMLGQHISQYLIPLTDTTEHVFDACYTHNSSAAVYTKVKGLRGAETFSAQICVGKFGLGGGEYYVAALEDISEREKIQQSLDMYAKKLETSNQELQSFAYVASHDLQEPVRKIQSFGELLEREEASRLSESGQLYLERMISGANRMRTLISSLLELSRIGKTEVQREWVSLEKICTEVLDDLEQQVLEKNATVTIGELPRLYGVPDQLRSLMLNLMGNALKYSSDTEQVTVDVAVFTPTEALVAKRPELASLPVMFSVKDNGIGISEEYRERIFIAFQRLHGKSKYQGTGIGLAICKKIVEQMGGAMFVEAAAPTGSEFIVALPKVVEDITE